MKDKTEGIMDKYIVLVGLFLAVVFFQALPSSAMNEAGTGVNADNDSPWSAPTLLPAGSNSGEGNLTNVVKNSTWSEPTLKPVGENTGNDGALSVSENAAIDTSDILQSGPKR